MLTRREIALGLATVAVCLQALAAGGVDGKWQVKTRRSEGSTKEFSYVAANIVIDLRVDGEELTGTLSDFNDVYEVQEGRVERGRVSFVCYQVFGDAPDEKRIEYTGELQGDELVLTQTEPSNTTNTEVWRATRIK